MGHMVGGSINLYMQYRDWEYKYDNALPKFMMLFEAFMLLWQTFKNLRMFDALTKMVILIIEVIWDLIFFLIFWFI